MGLINTPITFQAIINHILHDLLDNGVLVYINDILIYTKTIEEHNRLILDILERLRQNNLAIAPQKCKWCIQEIEFLNYIISPQGIKISKDKTDAIENWQAPRTLKKGSIIHRFRQLLSTVYQGFLKDRQTAYKLHQPIIQRIEIK